MNPPASSRLDALFALARDAADRSALRPGRADGSLFERVSGRFPSGTELPARDWERHHALVLRVLIGLLIVVPVYATARGFGVIHAVGHALPLLLLTVLAGWSEPGRTVRSASAAAGLMTACALVS